MIFVLINLILYCALLVALHVGWSTALRKRPPSSQSSYPLISVVVSVRNEEKNIPTLIASLKNQLYANFEVITVNDHSTDLTMEELLRLRFGNMIIVNNKDHGKKAAIETGVALAKGEIIVTTDADCVAGSNWLESIERSFSNPQVMMAFGAVGMQANTYFSRLQAAEFASLIGSGAATAALGFPTMCNGANLAYRKVAFIEVRGYEGNHHIASGDDEFLMRKIISRYPNSVSFIAHPSASVVTSAQLTIKDFVSQRLRWAGKWRSNSSVSTIALAVFIFVSQLSLIAAYALISLSLNPALIIILFFKIIVEGVFIARVCRFTKTTFSLPAFLVLQVVYPFYVITIALLSNFTHPVWKSRKTAQ